jgi:hypothetical protein
MISFYLEKLLVRKDIFLYKKIKVIRKWGFFLGW